MSSKPKLITECYVKPSIEITKSNRIHNLNPFDLKWLPFHYAQIGYLYSKPDSKPDSSAFTMSSFLTRLRSSLSDALVYFYPLAGRLVTVPNPNPNPNPNLNDRSCYVYVDCSIGRGVSLVHASASELTVGCIVGLGSDVPKVVRYLFDLGEVYTNHDGHTRPLVSVQVTELKDGLFLGVCVNHAVVDGTSAFHFIRVWSHVFTGTLLSSSTPLPLVKQPDFIHGRVYPSELKKNQKNLLLNSDSSTSDRSDVEESESELSRRFFRFSPQSLKKIKAMGNSDSSSNNNNNNNNTTFLSLIAFVWKCITRVRNLNPDDPTTCAVPINLRPRFNPPLTNEYFGNYAVKAMTSVKVSDLLENSVRWASGLLKQAVEAQDDTSARNLVLQARKYGPEALPPVKILGSTNVTVAGSTRFDLNESGFGLGRLVAFRSGNVNKVDGKVNAYSGSDGDGGVDLDICLASDTMRALLLDREFMRFTSQYNGQSGLISRI